jgi:hypothetical protein
VVTHGTTLEDSADFYVAALPVEVMRLLAGDELKEAEPRLVGLPRLRTRWSGRPPIEVGQPIGASPEQTG